MHIAYQVTVLKGIGIVVYGTHYLDYFIAPPALLL